MPHSTWISYSLVAAVVAGVVVGTAAQTQESADMFISAVEKAHGSALWYQKAALQAGFSVAGLKGTMLFRTNLGASRLELDDGTGAVFDGRAAWVSPAGSKLKGARFHLLTWPYFVALPMKLRDPGTHLTVLGSRKMDGKSYTTARLTFDAGVGDTPEDWYVLYREPESGRLIAAAYIVTYGKARAEAEREPHVMVYSDFVDVDGVSIATTWAMRHWSEDRGVYGKPLGTGKLTEPRFVDPAPDAFVRPKDAREDALPKP